MASSPPTKESKRHRLGNAVRRGIDRVQQAISPSPSSQPSGTSTLTPSKGVGSFPASSVTPNLSTAQLVPHRGPDAVGELREPTLSAGTILVPPPVLTSPSASPEPGTIDKLKERGSVAWAGLKTALRSLEMNADGFPSLKSAVGTFVACLDIIQAAATNRKDYDELASELSRIAITLNQYLPELGLEDPSGSAARIALSIEGELTHISRQQYRGKGRRLIEAAQDIDDVIKRYHRIEALFRQLQNDIGLRTWRDTNKQHVLSLLRGTSPVDDARYNSSYSTTIKRRGCTADTRESVLAELRDWIWNPDAAKVYWMNGMAGTGKTTIAYSLCEWLETNQQLGASFFCSRVSSSCSNVNRIVPTLAYQLARYSPVFRSALCKVLEDDPDTGKLNVVWQFKKLIQEPLQKVRNAMPEGVVMVIDALDECEDSYGMRLVLETLLKLAPELPVKFFVASRPEPTILDKMLSPGGYSSAVLHLHDIEQSIVEEDIKKYLTEALSSMSPSPSPNEIEQLAKLSGNLFIYAATAVRWILPHDVYVDSSARLEAMLATQPTSDSKPKSSKKYKELDILYTSILAAAFNSDRLEEEEMERMRLVLWTVVCAREPMTVQTLASLLELSERQVSSAINPLRSVLYMSESSGLVSPLHASFPDYMLDQLRCRNFYCDKAQHSEHLAYCCFKVMNAELRFNICNLESSFVFDSDVPDLEERIKACISPVLFYACRHWGEHLQQAGSAETLEDMLLDFLTHTLLFWMEVLNLRRCVASGTDTLLQAESWLLANNVNTDTQKQVADAKAFVTRFAKGACTRSTPHIYISSLPFCPRTSWVHENYWNCTRGLMDVKGTAIDRTEKNTLDAWVTRSNIYAAAISPDGTRIVTGSEDCTIAVWDVRTGNIAAGPFEGHTEDVYSVAFSPDGHRIASGSADCTIRVWDTYTGNTSAGPFIGHGGEVFSVAFSPDGTRIVSGSSDHTIRVWDAHTGDIAVRFREGHTNMVRSVAFSPDGTHIASGSDDCTIRLWDAHTGHTVIGSFKGHTGKVHSVAFSPDGTRIVSGSDDRTIRVWDAQTGNATAGPFEGNKGEVASVAFSPDGTRIVSGSMDGNIQVWDAHTGNTTAGLFEGHTNTVHSVVFSPDGTHIISGSYDCTIRVWDAFSSDPATGSLGGHNGAVLAVAFSPSGTSIVSGSYDCTIRLWDAHTSETVTGPFEGHEREVWSASFSPDGTHIVSGSGDCTIRVWDVHTGHTVAGPFKGHTGKVKSVAFSPDGTRIVSGSTDCTTQVWDAYTGHTATSPFKGHTGKVLSVAFSPDGTRTVSGSADRTIRVWDIHKGHTIAGPFEGHTGKVKSVAFSPDGSRIASGSMDHTIRVWDACTGGSATTRPFAGHTGAVWSVAFSPDGTRIVSGSADCTVRVWDARTGDPAAGLFAGHTDKVISVAFSPDGTSIASGSVDRTIRVWDARTSNTTETFQSNPASVHSTVLSPSVSLTATPADHNTDHVLTNDQILSMMNLATYDYDYITPIGTSCFTLADDGWVTTRDSLLLWISSDFRNYLPYPNNDFVIGPRGNAYINYKNLLLGERWSKCYISR